jgi:hypothetical protein
MNIAEILKKCPKGTKLYSSLYGEVELVKVKDNTIYPIVVSCLEFENYIMKFDKDGKNMTAHKEPTLFPSKTQRDWSKFGINDQETKHQFKPFDKVLVRDDDDTTWRCDFFSHLGDKGGVFICLTTWWKQCIPYEGNEHLLGTTNNPEE